MHSFYLGIDVAKAKLDCALRLPEGKMGRDNHLGRSNDNHDGRW